MCFLFFFFWVTDSGELFGMPDVPGKPIFLILKGFFLIIGGKS